MSQYNPYPHLTIIYPEHKGKGARVPFELSMLVEIVERNIRIANAKNDLAYISHATCDLIPTCESYANFLIGNNHKIKFLGIDNDNMVFELNGERLSCDDIGVNSTAFGKWLNEVGTRIMAESLRCEHRMRS